MSTCGRKSATKWEGVDLDGHRVVVTKRTDRSKLMAIYVTTDKKRQVLQVRCELWGPDTDEKAEAAASEFTINIAKAYCEGQVSVENLAVFRDEALTKIDKGKESTVQKVMKRPAGTKKETMSKSAKKSKSQSPGTPIRSPEAALGIAFEYGINSPPGSDYFQSDHESH